MIESFMQFLQERCSYTFWIQTIALSCPHRLLTWPVARSTRMSQRSGRTIRWWPHERAWRWVVVESMVTITTPMFEFITIFDDLKPIPSYEINTPHRSSGALMISMSNRPSSVVMPTRLWLNVFITTNAGRWSVPTFRQLSRFVILPRPLWSRRIKIVFACRSRAMFWQGIFL